MAVSGKEENEISEVYIQLGVLGIKCRRPKVVDYLSDATESVDDSRPSCGLRKNLLIYLGERQEHHVGKCLDNACK